MKNLLCKKFSLYSFIGEDNFLYETENLTFDIEAFNISEGTYYYNKYTSLSFDEIIKNEIYDLTYIDKFGYMYSETNLEYETLLKKVEYLKKSKNIEDGMAVVYNIKDRLIFINK